MRDSEYNANEALRGAAAVIGRSISVQHDMARDFRRRAAGAEAIGMLSALLKLDALPGIYRAQADRLIREFER